MDNTTNQTPQSWRKTIREAAEAAKDYAEAVANDYADDWRQAKEADRAEAARRAASAFQHASDWYRTADKIIEALDGNPDDKYAAMAIQGAIHQAGQTTQADWLCPIAEALGKAVTEALASATAGTVGTGDQDDKAQAAASLVKAYAETVTWG